MLRVAQRYLTMSPRSSARTPPRSGGTKPSSPSSRGPSGAVKLYLTAYNAAAAAAWSYVLYRVAAHMGGADGLTGLREWAGLQGTAETMLKRSRTAVDECVLKRRLQSGRREVG